MLIVYVDPLFLAFFRLSVSKNQRTVNSMRFGAVSFVTIHQNHDATLSDVSAAFKLLPSDSSEIYNLIDQKKRFVGRVLFVNLVCCLYTVDAESIRTSAANWKVGNEFTQSTLDRTWIDFDIVWLGASVIDRRSVGHSQSSSVSGRVFSVRDSRQFTRSRNAFRCLSMCVDILAEPAAIHFRSLDDVARIATKQRRFIVRNFRVRW